jgi:hypothetical protein
MLATLWLITTLTGWRMARRRRFAEHRRWMIRSFALTLSIMLNRVLGVALLLILSPQLNSTFHGDEELLTQTIAGIGTWLGWTLSLLTAEWWNGDSGRRRPDPRPKELGLGELLRQTRPQAGFGARAGSLIMRGSGCPTRSLRRRSGAVPDGRVN